MATKPHAHPQDNTGSSVLAQFPPPISLTSSILASTISLPDHPEIAYSVFTGSPTNAVDHLNLIELARRKVLSQNTNRTLVESLLPSVHITKDVSALYVFALGSADRASEAHAALAALQLEGLSLIESSTFSPSAIYPCSTTCSSQLTPCPECLKPSSAAPPTASSSAHLLPRKPLRLPFHHFLRAVGERLINDIAEASSLSPNSRQATRLRDGFLLGPAPASSEWSAGWEHHARGRPLIYCHLQVHLTESPSATRLLIHPVLRPTFYLPLDASLPVPSGTPITLLPHGVPAYYLNTYAGPASALTSQFQDALVGLGAGDWKGTSSTGWKHTDPSNTMGTKAPTYIIAWLSVQNKQGEDKGMPVIWPVRLCLSYHPNSPSPHARTPLPYNPELPAQLQASPPPPPAAVPLGLVGGKPGLSLSTDNYSSLDATLQPPPSAHVEREQLSSPIIRRPRKLTSSPTTESLRAFRALTLTTKPYARDMRKVAAEVSGYVDSVAKERERERERMKREREGANTRGRAVSTSGGLAPASSSPPVPEQSTPEAARSEQIATPAAEAVPELREESMAEQNTEPPLPSSQESSSDSLFSPPAGAISPSPPDDSMDVSMEPKVEAEPMDLSSLSVPPEAPPVVSHPDAMSTFDPFGGLDSAWGQSSNDFMSIGYSMGFNMNIDSLRDSHSGGIDTGAFDMDDGFGDFTDDDFNFFDGPSAQARTATVPIPPIHVDNAIKAGEGLTPAAGPAPLGFSPQRVGDALHTSGPGPPSLALTQSSPWAPHSLAEGFTPHPVDFHYLGDGIPPAPDLLPPSPSKTPSTHSAPTTPAVQLSDHSENAAVHKSTYMSLGPNIFDPIPFAPSHRATDGKYAVGKFALPSPPDSEDRTEAMFFSTSAPSALGGWKYRYSAATDPRIGVVRKLIGVKRKSFDQGMRDHRMSPSWVREHEEWESNTPQVIDDSKSDGESEDDEPWQDDDEATAASRPSTPPPSYLPLGPTLIQTHFHHSRLLPLSSPLRPPGALVSNTLVNTALISVPTPVSPAAVLGTASEKSKSLEAAAHILVKEIVENPVWADVWRSNAAASSIASKPPTQVWQTDVKRVRRLLQSVQGIRTPIDLGSLSSIALSSDEDGVADSLRLLESPMFDVGKSDSVIQVLPTALRFWEKLGLSPRAGRKDVTAYVFFEGGGDERESQIVEWLDRVSATYMAKNFGTHTVGTSGDCSKPGLHPLRFDQAKKTLVNFIANLQPLPQANLVFYIVTPSSAIAPTSATLRPLFSAVKRAAKAYPHLGVLFHFVPEAFTTGALDDPRAVYGGLEFFVASVYDRIPRPVERSMSRRLLDPRTRIRACFHAPAFALASPLSSASSMQPAKDSPRVTFTLESHPSSLDVVDRHAMLHVGYQMSSCGRWLLAACVDERGEEHDWGTWLSPSESLETFLVSQIWTFARTFAARADIEWRIVLAKLGTMSEREFDAWMDHFDEVMTPDLPPMRITLLAVEHENPWTLLSPTDDNGVKHAHVSAPLTAARSSPRAPSGAVLADTAFRTYSFSPPAASVCVPALSSNVNHTLNSGLGDRPFIPDCEDEEPLLQRQPHLRVRGTSTLIHAPAVTDYTSVSMVHLYHLHSAFSSRSSQANRLNTAVYGGKQPEGGVEADEQILRDIADNYHALAILARLRWKLPDSSGLPLHLAALEAMRIALMGESHTDP